MKNFLVLILLMVVGVSCKVKDEASAKSVVGCDTVCLVSKNDRTLHSQDIKNETVKDIKIDTVYPGYPQIDTLQYLVDKEFTNMDSTEVNAVIRYSINPYHEFFNDLYYDILGGALIRDSNLFERLIDESQELTDYQRHQIIQCIDEALCWHCYVTYNTDAEKDGLTKIKDSDDQTVLALRVFRDSLETDTEVTIRAMYGTWNGNK